MKNLCIYILLKISNILIKSFPNALQTLEAVRLAAQATKKLIDVEFLLLCYYASSVI